MTALAVLLTILKILGILILIILGLILAIVLLVLLVPIRYDAKGELHEEKYVRVRVHWLLHLLTIALYVRGKALEITVKILGITLFSSAKVKENKKEADDSVNKSEEEQKEEQAAAEKTEKEEVKSAAENIGSGDNKLMSENSDSGEQETAMESAVQENGELSESVSEHPSASDSTDSVTTDIKPRKRSLWERIEDKIDQLSDAITDKLEHIEQTMEDLQEKIEKLQETVSYYYNLISHERTKSLIGQAVREIWGVIKYIAPTKLKANLHIGMENPYQTGQICMAAAILYPVYQNSIQLEPDFEQKVLEGDFFLKGRIRLGRFIVVAVKLLVNRDFWFVIRRIKPKEKGKAGQQRNM